MTVFFLSKLSKENEPNRGKERDKQEFAELADIFRLIFHLEINPLQIARSLYYTTLWLMSALISFYVITSSFLHCTSSINWSGNRSISYLLHSPLLCTWCVCLISLSTCIPHNIAILSQLDELVCCLIKIEIIFFCDLNQMPSFLSAETISTTTAFHACVCAHCVSFAWLFMLIHLLECSFDLLQLCRQV